MLLNTQLTRNIVASELHREDAEDIIRIFSILSDERKIYILDHWNDVIAGIQVSRRQFEEEQEILLRQAIKQIENDLAAHRIDTQDTPLAS